MLGHRPGAVAIIASRGGELPHLRDDLPDIAWPGHWSVLGSGRDPGKAPRETTVRELDEEASGIGVDPESA
ncbi:NUDIX domain-containing protein [Streptomyces sp. NPDC057199]|uniref:NUDIX domain-containing protein n=1 Tax=Streptomyces sp. NPDC057199 TaxID=3346047 RepID=UPI003639BD84